MRDIAIIILNWNGKLFLERFLPSVMRYSDLPRVEIIVADNGSSDDSLSFLQQHYPQISIIRLHKNYGFAGGYNRALQHLQHTYFVLLNSDVEVIADWIYPLIQRMEVDRSIAVCMPKIKSWHDRNKFEYAGAAGGFIDKYGYPFCRGRYIDVVEEDNGQYNLPLEVFWASGACMFIRADVFRFAGGFDDRFFAHMEEIDLCWRIKNLGYKVFCFPDVEVYHAGGGTLPYNTPKKIYLNFRNNLFTLYKNMLPQDFRAVFRIRIVLDLLAALRFLLRGKFISAVAIIIAYWAFLKNKKHYVSKKSNRLRIVEIKEIVSYSIVLEYWLHRRRKYSELSGVK